MRKLFILFILFSFPALVYATSGTCSWHNGINCEAGRDSDGSVVCNDGWRDSSEKYSDNCKRSLNCQKIQCYVPTPDVGSRCWKEKQYQELYTQSIRSSTTDYYDGMLSECRQGIENYKNKQQEYEQCKIDSEKYYNECLDSHYGLLCYDYYGYNSYYDKSSQNCLCKDSYYSDLTTGYCEKIPSCPNNSSLNSNYKCICNDGYEVEENKCVISASYCENTTGFNSHPRNNAEYGYESSTGSTLCECNKDYEIKNNKCVLKETKYLSLEAKQWVDNKKGMCERNTINLSEEEVLLCKQYSLWPNRYIWKIYEPSQQEKTLISSTEQKQEEKIEVSKIENKKEDVKNSVEKEVINMPKIKNIEQETLKTSKKATTTSQNSTTNPQINEKPNKIFTFIKSVFLKLKFWR